MYCVMWESMPSPYSVYQSEQGIVSRVLIIGRVLLQYCHDSWMA